MHIPTLSTGRLRLRPLDADCLALYTAFYTDAEASRDYGGPLSAAGAFNRLASDIGGWQLQGFGVWAVQLRQGNVEQAGDQVAGGADPGSGPVEDDLVGVCGFWQGLGWPRELTWWLLPQHRGQGIAAEASRAAIAHAYGAWGWDRVDTYMADSNHAARALVLRLGGQVSTRQVFPDGQARDLFLLPRPGGPPRVP